MAQLPFSNLAPSAAKSTLLSVLDDSHVFSPKETMQAHIANGGTIETWSYFFSLVIISDKTKAELDYLLDDMIILAGTVNDWIQKYKFFEPVYGTAEYWEMRNTGQIVLTFAEFQPFIGLN